MSLPPAPAPTVSGADPRPRGGGGGRGRHQEAGGDEGVGGGSGGPGRVGVGWGGGAGVARAGRVGTGCAEVVPVINVAVAGGEVGALGWGRGLGIWPGTAARRRREHRAASLGPRGDAALGRKCLSALRAFVAGGKWACCTAFAHSCCNPARWMARLLKSSPKSTMRVSRVSFFPLLPLLLFPCLATAIDPAVISALGGAAVLGVASSIKVVTSGNTCLIERMGKFNRQLQPGWHWCVPVIERSSMYATTREQVMDVPPQQCYTKDNAPVRGEGEGGGA